VADVPAYEVYMRRGDGIAFQEMEEFFMKTGKVHQTLRELLKRLNETAIPYAVIGALAMGLHGYTRATVNVDVLITLKGLEDFKSRFDYVPAFDGAKKSLRDTRTGVRIAFFLAGEYPGDGLPKAVGFPDPAKSSQEIDGVRVVTLEKLIELKLASGMSAPHRLMDLSDVQKMIRELQLPIDFGNRLDASVQQTFQQLWQQAQVVDKVHENVAPGA